MHSLMSPKMIAYQVRFYDWSDFHQYNKTAKRYGQIPNHVSVGIIGADNHMWEPVVDLDGATWKRSPVVERAYNEPMHRFTFNRVGPMKPIWELVDQHRTSSIGYHYFWQHTGRLLPTPSNCVSLTTNILQEFRVPCKGKDVVSLMLEVNNVCNRSGWNGPRR